MTKSILIIAGIVVALLVAYAVGERAYKKRISPEAEAIFNSSNLDMIVNYCRPSRKGNQVFGASGVVPYGKIWRTGANESTEITLNQDVLVHDEILPAGSYSIFTIPEKDDWTVIFNSELNQWGLFDYEAKNDVLRIRVKSQNLKTKVEVFTIEFVEEEDVINMQLKWENTLVIIPFNLIE